ncbi:uncharacterized protein [Mytilus edulis]|uniref:uncharacterized protein isoform X1 n=1 Tax=Mytilus edulis TaxID=6550 RepID=UPI0039EF0578
MCVKFYRPKDTQNSCLSAVTAIACVVFFIIFRQEAGADDCSSRQIESCSTNLTNTLQEAAVEGDKNKKCWAAHTLLHCLKKIVTDCNLDPNNSTISQILPRFQHEISQYGCETANGARSLVNNFVVMIFGLTFYKLLKVTYL